MLSFLYVYSDHSILECYNLFSGVELSMRSFFVISTQWLVVGICIQVILLVNLVCSFDARLDGLIFELDADGTKHRL